MTLVKWPGMAGMVWPALPLELIGLTPGFQSLGVIDATGEKYAICGPVQWSDYGNHNIHQVWFRAGAIVSAGGSGIILSLQDLDTATGAPARPDGVQDQTVASLLSALTADGANLLTLATDRVGVGHGVNLAIVWEYDGAGRLGADSLVISGVIGSTLGVGAMPTLLTGTWAQIGHNPNVVLIASDGTIGTLGLSYPASAFNSHAFNVNSAAADEIANQIVVPAPTTLTCIELGIAVANGADLSLVVYNGTTPIGTLAIDEDTGIFHVTAGQARWCVFFPTAPIELAAGTYRVAIQPTTANNVTVFSMDVASASYLELMAGPSTHYWDRLNAGAWANENLTRFVLMRLHFGKTDDGGGLAQVVADVAQIKADLPTRFTKNTAWTGRFGVRMFDALTHLPRTGLTVLAQRSLDGGATWGNCANAVVEGINGWYYLDGFAASDLNADGVALSFTATGADSHDITIITQPT